jgi:Flp pilus assembly protein TadB
MNLKDVILLSLSAALIIIGVHLAITQGIGLSYPVLMFAVALLFWFKYRRNKAVEAEKSNQKRSKKPFKKQP